MRFETNSENSRTTPDLPQWFWHFFRLHTRFPWSRVEISSALQSGHPLHFRSNLNLHNSQNEGNDFLHHMLLDIWCTYYDCTQKIPFETPNNLYKHASFEELYSGGVLLFEAHPDSFLDSVLCSKCKNLMLRGSPKNFHHRFPDKRNGQNLQGLGDFFRFSLWGRWVLAMDHVLVIENKVYISELLNTPK